MPNSDRISKMLSIVFRKMSLDVEESSLSMKAMYHLLADDVKACDYGNEHKPELMHLRRKRNYGSTHFQQAPR